MPDKDGKTVDSRLQNIDKENACLTILAEIVSSSIFEANGISKI